jgi:hypothetical protein
MQAYAYYEAREYDDSISAAKRYVTLHPGSGDAAYAQFLIASSLLRGNSDYQPRSGPHRTGDAGARRSGAQISDHRIRDQRQEEARSRARPARRQGDAGRPLVSGEQGLHRRDQPLQNRGHAITRPRAMSRKR